MHHLMFSTKFMFFENPFTNICSSTNNTTHTKAADVASLRPSTAARPSGAMSRSCSYSNASSRKLYSLLTSLHATGGYSHTFGALDPVQVVQMAPRKFNDLLF